MSDEQSRTTPLPVTRAMVVEALQNAWNDYTSDTGRFPESFTIQRGELVADFERSHFASMVTTRLLDEIARVEGSLPMCGDAPTTTPALRWRWHSDTFASLMIGRVQLAQISHGPTHWSWTLFFCERGERSNYSDESKEEAMRAAEDHAARVLTA